MGEIHYDLPAASEEFARALALDPSLARANDRWGLYAEASRDDLGVDPSADVERAVARVYQG